MKIDGDSVTVADKVTIDKNGIDMDGTKLTVLGAGSISEGSTDAVSGGQLWETNQTVDEIGSVLGGAENGYKKPTFDTVTANDINVGKVNISGSGINMGGADITTGGGNIDMGGGRITNVAGGAIAQGSTDAVNGGQLWDAYQRMDAMGGDIYRRMDDLREDVNIVGAHAAALSGLHPIDYNPYEPTTLSAAIGTYRDEYAVAVGVFHYAKENVMFNLGASLCSDGDVMGRAGVSFTVGKSSDKPKTPKNMNEVQAQLAQVDDRLAKCAITSPVGGTVLAKYAERGELAAEGRSLLLVGDLKRMRLRAYVDAPTLTRLKIGQQVMVYADDGEDGRREYRGRIEWISDKAEFTPKTIQTRDERANLVYAVKVAVQNDGFIKRGMYGEMKVTDN